jgi:hypothetical protein
MDGKSPSAANATRRDNMCSARSKVLRHSKARMSAHVKGNTSKAAKQLIHYGGATAAGTAARGSMHQITLMRVLSSRLASAVTDDI